MPNRNTSLRVRPHINELMTTMPWLSSKWIAWPGWIHKSIWKLNRRQNKAWISLYSHWSPCTDFSVESKVQNKTKTVIHERRKKKSDSTRLSKCFLWLLFSVFVFLFCFYHYFFYWSAVALQSQLFSSSNPTPLIWYPIPFFLNYNWNR